MVDSSWLKGVYEMARVIAIMLVVFFLGGSRVLAEPYRNFTEITFRQASRAGK